MTSKQSKSLRYPSFVMYPEDVAARKAIMPFWKKRMGPTFSFADVLRRLARAEAESIKAQGASTIAV